MKTKLDIINSKKIITFDSKKESNGWVLPIVADNDNFSEFIRGQVYLTVVSPGKQKGFHLHNIKTNHLTCIRGNVTIGVYDGEKIHKYKAGDKNLITIKVPPKMPIAIFNNGSEDAYVINYCFPAYDKKVKEQEEVEIDWNPNEQ